MSIDDRTLMAFADGELDGPAREVVAAAVSADAALANRLERFRKVRALLADPLKAAAPPPRDGLMAAARRGVAGEVAVLRYAIPALAAGVAALAIGIGFTQFAGGGFQRFQPGATAAGVLQAALDDTASGDTARRGAARVQPLYTVVANDGRRCRVFRAFERAAAYEGAACRMGKSWSVIAIAPVVGASGGFSQASGDEPVPVTAAIDALRPGDPLDAGAERALIAADWKTARE